MAPIVSNPSADRQEKIANAANVIGKSKVRLDVFCAIYTGKKRVKTVGDIRNFLNQKYSRIEILNQGKRLASEDIVTQIKTTETAYEKKDFYTHNKAKIISLVKNKEKREKFPTKFSPSSKNQTQVETIIRLPRSFIKTKLLTIDDIDSFSKVRKINSIENSIALPENLVKKGILEIIGEKGTFKDWGGELCDIFSTSIIVNKKRISVAFALKGPGKHGKLVPKMMGKNGDQIQRLFLVPAQAFIVQYNEQIDLSVLQQMTELAKAKSVSEGKEIFFGIINGTDSSRLVKAYPNEFKK